MRETNSSGFRYDKFLINADGEQNASFKREMEMTFRGNEVPKRH